MYWDGALGAAIEVAIAIAGFSGIVAALGRRSPGGWTATDQLQLQALLTASATAGLFAFLPFVLHEATGDSHTTWRAGSAAQAVWFLWIMVYRLRQASRVGAEIRGFRVLIPLTVLTLAAQVFNAALLAQSWLYVVGVIFQLSVGFSAFATLLLRTWRDDTPTA